MSYQTRPFIVEKGLQFSIKNKDITKSYVRTWQDKSGKPYKYEFRGEAYQGYHNPSELIIT